VKLTKWFIFKSLLIVFIDGIITGVAWSAVIFGSLFLVLIIAGKIYCKVKGI